MVAARVCDWMYRLWTPYDVVGVRKDLIDLLERGKCPHIAAPRRALRRLPGLPIETASIGAQPTPGW